MDTRADTRADTELLRAYMHTLTTSRVSMNNMLNIIIQQDRNMQSIISMSQQHRHILGQRHAMNNGINYSDVSDDLPRFAQNIPNHRRTNTSTRGGMSPRQFANINNRVPLDNYFQNHRRYHVERNHNTPLSTNGTSVNQHVNQPVNQHVNQPVNQPVWRPDHQPDNMSLHPRWLNTVLNNFESLTPVNVRPTEAEINNSTEEVRFGIVSNPVNSACPITRERFGENDRVIQIVYCGHNFNPPSLRHWFQTNVRCPLCRYDIRDYDPRNAINNPYRTTAPRVTRDDTSIQRMEERFAAQVLNSLGQSDSSNTGINTPITPNSERTIQVNVANRENVVSSIASYISQDIMAQLDNMPIDGSGNIMLEYSFRNPVEPQTIFQENSSDQMTHDLSGSIQ